MLAERVKSSSSLASAATIRSPVGFGSSAPSTTPATHNTPHVIRTIERILVSFADESNAFSEPKYTYEIASREPGDLQEDARSFE
jgi:hypothetical protein